MPSTAAANSLWPMLLPHQQRVVMRMLEPDREGLIAAHGLGSGKTLTSIAVQEALNCEADIVVPASLVKNYEKEVRRWAPGSTLKRRILSLQSCAKDYTLAASIAAPLVIIDEGHRGRNDLSATAQRVFNVRKMSQKRLILTATPFYDHPKDISTLLHAVTIDDDTLQVGKDFESYFVKDRPAPARWWERLLRGARDGVEPHLDAYYAEELRGVLSRTVDYHPNSTVGFPRVRRTEVLVPMTDQQEEEHLRLRGEVPAWVSIMVAAGLAPRRRDAGKVNAFLCRSRQVCDEWEGAAPKVDAAVRRLQDALGSSPRAKVLVYSNFIAAGLEPYRRRLDALGIRYATFTGEDPRAKRDLGVLQYNRGEVRVLLVSSAGGEGLDLVGTRVVQVIEPCWNRSKVEQVEGRAIRYGSHAHLPEAERTVEVQSYLMTTRAKGLSTDQYLTKMSADKERLLDEFRALLPKEWR
jgi:SNF2 family DNA or RNA helicase